MSLTRTHGSRWTHIGLLINIVRSAVLLQLFLQRLPFAPICYPLFFLNWKLGCKPVLAKPWFRFPLSMHSRHCPGYILAYCKISFWYIYVSFKDFFFLLLFFYFFQSVWYHTFHRMSYMQARVVLQLIECAQVLMTCDSSAFYCEEISNIYNLGESERASTLIGLLFSLDYLYILF